MGYDEDAIVEVLRRIATALEKIAERPLVRVGKIACPQCGSDSWSNTIEPEIPGRVYCHHCGTHFLDRKETRYHLKWLQRQVDGCNERIKKEEADRIRLNEQLAKYEAELAEISTRLGKVVAEWKAQRG